MVLTLRDRQIAAIEKILNLNQSPPAQDDQFEHANGLIPEAAPIVNGDGQPMWVDVLRSLNLQLT